MAAVPDVEGVEAFICQLSADNTTYSVVSTLCSAMAWFYALHNLPCPLDQPRTRLLMEAVKREAAARKPPTRKPSVLALEQIHMVGAF